MVVKRASLALFVFVLLPPLSSFAGAPNPRPVDRTQLTAWLTGELSNPRICRLVTERGIAFSLTLRDEKQLRATGADSTLIKTLRALRSSVSPSAAAPLPAALAKAAQLTHEKQYDAAEGQLSALIRSNSDNASLHFALGDVLRREDKWDKALDEFTEAVRLMPGFPDAHNRLAYVFYRTDDVDAAIAEARTALSWILETLRLIVILV